MSKIKFYYDTETCKYERVQTTVSDILLNAAGFIILSLLFAAGLLFLYNHFFKSPAEQLLIKENKELKFYYKLLEKEMKEVSLVLNQLQDRDNNIYRTIFGSEPLNTDNKIHTIETYRELLDKNLSNKELIVSLYYKIDKIKKALYEQSKSYDNIVALAKDKDKMLMSIPAIQPLSNPDLTRLVSGFGYRMHPIYKVMMFHSGVDFHAPRGTPVYATGDGVVVTVNVNPGGYGKEIEIDHGFGYKTKYAHLDRFNVVKGKKVKRGELIGFTGSTGAATAPHLHYEVIYRGEKVNPVHYFFKDLNEQQYKKILELAEVENQSLS
ncbi:MAG: M23 family metallopeptidase [Cytophagaceae bacterium]|nr:M23 family metallopeptidase [Cytophagaceae bacterium]MDW8456545.1 M23 family metallopeptidase [Cytophagaceae bacterium]